MPTQNPTNPFPAWRLPTGIIKASDGDLERSIGSCERWAWFGGAVVIGGVAAEIAIAAYHPLYDSWLEQWGSALANSLVAIGVALEIIFSQMAGLRQNELRRRSDEKAVEANARAAKADQKAQEAALEISRLKADNLALQTVLLPRHVGAIGFNGPPPCSNMVCWYASIRRYRDFDPICSRYGGAESRKRDRNSSLTVWMATAVY
jgi:hypothetical protein